MEGLEEGFLEWSGDAGAVVVEVDLGEWLGVLSLELCGDGDIFFGVSDGIGGEVE